MSAQSAKQQFGDALARSLESQDGRPLREVLDETVRNLVELQNRARTDSRLRFTASTAEALNFTRNALRRAADTERRAGR